MLNCGLINYEGVGVSWSLNLTGYWIGAVCRLVYIERKGTSLISIFFYFDFPGNPCCNRLSLADLIRLLILHRHLYI